MLHTNTTQCTIFSFLLVCVEAKTTVFNIITFTVLLFTSVAYGVIQVTTHGVHLLLIFHACNIMHTTL
jgi:hypothetical protein